MSIFSKKKTTEDLINELEKDKEILNGLLTHIKELKIIDKKESKVTENNSPRFEIMKKIKELSNERNNELKDINDHNIIKKIENDIKTEKAENIEKINNFKNEFSDHYKIYKSIIKTISEKCTEIKDLIEQENKNNNQISQVTEEKINLEEKEEKIKPILEKNLMIDQSCINDINELIKNLDKLILILRDIPEEELKNINEIKENQEAKLLEERNEFIEKVIDNDTEESKFIWRTMRAYRRIFLACSYKNPKFEDYDAIIVMDREGRIPYYYMHAYCVDRNQKVPKQENVFFLKTSGHTELFKDALIEIIGQTTNSSIVQEAYRQIQKRQKYFSIAGEKINNIDRIKSEYAHKDPEILAYLEKYNNKNSYLNNEQIFGAELLREIHSKKNNQFHYWCDRDVYLYIGVIIQKNSFQKLIKYSSYCVKALNFTKSAIQKTKFHHTLSTLAARKSRPKILLFDASECDGHQKKATAEILLLIYGSHLHIDKYTVTRVIDRSNEMPLIVYRDYLEILPTNHLTLKGFIVSYFLHEDKKIINNGFMEGDLIGSKREDQFVTDLKNLSIQLAKQTIPEDKLEEKIKFLQSNPFLIDYLKRIFETAKTAGYNFY